MFSFSQTVLLQRSISFLTTVWFNLFFDTGVGHPHFIICCYQSLLYHNLSPSLGVPCFLSFLKKVWQPITYHLFMHANMIYMQVVACSRKSWEPCMTIAVRYNITQVYNQVRCNYVIQTRKDTAAIGIQYFTCSNIFPDLLQANVRFVESLELLSWLMLVNTTLCDILWIIVWIHCFVLFRTIQQVAE